MNPEQALCMRKVPVRMTARTKMRTGLDFCKCQSICHCHLNFEFGDFGNFRHVHVSDIF
jgi:hypothetical protein